MNIAFPAILLFFLLLPGFVFHYCYQSRDASAADLTPFSTTVLLAVCFSVMANVIVAVLATYCLGYQFRLGEILQLLVGGASSNAKLTSVYSRLDTHPFEPFFFFLSTNGLAILCGLLWRWLVKVRKLDYPQYRFYRKIRPFAPWYYLFSGIDAPGGESVDCTVVSAIVDLKDASYVYTGILSDYHLTNKGELDRLVLSSAARRKLADDRQEVGTIVPLEYDHRFYPIAGDYLVLRASECATLNVKYLHIE